MILYKYGMTSNKMEYFHPLVFSFTFHSKMSKTTIPLIDHNHHYEIQELRVPRSNSSPCDSKSAVSSYTSFHRLVPYSTRRQPSWKKDLSLPCPEISTNLTMREDTLYGLDQHAHSSNPCSSSSCHSCSCWFKQKIDAGMKLLCALFRRLRNMMSYTLQSI
ncbi:hypothetical protein Dimus_020022 [Dionaea muscipula]